MARSQPSADQRIRDLRKDLRALEQEEPGRDRARRLAALTRAAHADRQLNMAMHAAQQSLDDDPAAPDLLVDAYAIADEDPVVRLDALSDLRDLARYIGRDDVRAIADDRLESEATAWLADAVGGERRYRLRLLSSRVTEEMLSRLRRD